MARTGRQVLPGEEVAIAEEYMSGEGTFEEGGKVYASVVGELDLDERERLARVLLPNPPIVLQEGDVVIATVSDAKPAMIICEILRLEGNDRAVASETLASIHVSKIAGGYIDDPGSEFRPGDLIRAEVIQADPSVQLATARPHLGVVYARCRRCRTPLGRKGPKLYCEVCKVSEHRKVADDYRSVELVDAKA